MSKGLQLLAFFALFIFPQLALAASGPAAATSDSFGIFAQQLIAWFTGNLGYVIAILALMGSLIIYAFTHKGSVVVIGIIIAFLVGGGVGIARFFFVSGSDAFGNTSTFP